jgi:hypothetical protein
LAYFICFYRLIGSNYLATINRASTLQGERVARVTLAVYSAGIKLAETVCNM